MLKRTTKHRDATAERTEQALGRLRRYYDIGRRGQELTRAGGGVYGRGVVTLLADETGENPATLLKCRQFADHYTAAEFRQLCKLRRPNGSQSAGDTSPSCSPCRWMTNRSAPNCRTEQRRKDGRTGV